MKKLTEKHLQKGKSWRDLVYFPIIFNAIGLLFMCLLFIFSPESSIGSTEFNTVVYLSVFITEWSLVFIVIRRLKRQGVSLKQLIVPKIKYRVLPAILVFISLNALFTAYMVLSLRFGRISTIGNLNPLQVVFFIALSPMTAGFVEELIWRGYFVEELLKMGISEKKSILFSSISFAFIHGFFLIDKLAVTFLTGIIAGKYYVRERNLLTLMVAHVVMDIVAFILIIKALVC